MEKGLSGLRGRDFELSDVFYFSKKGLEAIVEDEVTQRFSSEELVSWNLLTRTNVNFQYISPRLTMVWVLGVIVRYCILLPLRYVSPPGTRRWYNWRSFHFVYLRFFLRCTVLKSLWSLLRYCFYFKGFFFFFCHGACGILTS